MGWDRIPFLTYKYWAEAQVSTSFGRPNHPWILAAGCRIAAADGLLQEVRTHVVLLPAMAQVLGTHKLPALAATPAPPAASSSATQDSGTSAPKRKRGAGSPAPEESAAKKAKKEYGPIFAVVTDRNRFVRLPVASVFVG